MSGALVQGRSIPSGAEPSGKAFQVISAEPINFFPSIMKKETKSSFSASHGGHIRHALLSGTSQQQELLKRDDCTPEWEGRAWSFYRTAPNDRHPGLWAQLQPHVNDLPKFQVDCVGVFDTVGALGIPLTPFRRLNRERYEFHDVELCTITKVNLHAIAIDEQRYPYAATIWRKPKFKGFRSITEQVWFPGSHSDIGGGYVPEELRQSAYQHSLDDITLDWMLKRLKAHFDTFPVEAAVWPNPSLDPSWAMAPQHEPRRGGYRVWPAGLRAIVNSEISPDGWHQRVVCRDRHAAVIGEMVHISALERLGQNIFIERRRSRYAPENLVTVLDRIAATYTSSAQAPSTEIKVVKWDGTIFDPRASADQSKILAIVKAAQERLSA